MNRQGIISTGKYGVHALFLSPDYKNRVIGGDYGPSVASCGQRGSPEVMGTKGHGRESPAVLAPCC